MVPTASQLTLPGISKHPQNVASRFGFGVLSPNPFPLMIVIARNAFNDHTKCNIEKCQERHENNVEDDPHNEVYG